MPSPIESQLPSREGQRKLKIPSCSVKIFKSQYLNDQVQIDTMMSPSDKAASIFGSQQPSSNQIHKRQVLSKVKLASAD